jgi:hypothetical protein
VKDLSSRAIASIGLAFVLILGSAATRADAESWTFETGTDSWGGSYPVIIKIKGWAHGPGEWAWHNWADWENVTASVAGSGNVDKAQVTVQTTFKGINLSVSAKGDLSANAQKDGCQDTVTSAKGKKSVSITYGGVACSSTGFITNPDQLVARGGVRVAGTNWLYHTLTVTVS